MTLPGGTVTLLFSDIEGSARLLERLGERYQEIHRDHRRILRGRLAEAGGQEVDTQGDAFFFSFARAKDAVAGAVAAQRELGEHAWPDGAEVRVRMGLHTGEPTVGEEGCLGMDVVRAARICSAGHGGQILLSETTRALLGNEIPQGLEIRDLGEAKLKDVQHERIFELALPERRDAFPPLKTAAPAKTGPTRSPRRSSGRSTSRSWSASSRVRRTRRSRSSRSSCSSGSSRCSSCSPRSP